MPKRKINLTPEIDRYVASRVESGQHAKPSEGLRAGPRQLERTEQKGKMKLEALRSAVLAGEESGLAEGDVVSEVRDRIRRRALNPGTV